MKKIYYILIAIATAGMTGCQSELEENFKDPGVYAPTTEVVSGMFTTLVSNGRTGFVNDYSDWWHQADAGGYLWYCELYARYYGTRYAWIADLVDPKNSYDPDGLQNTVFNVIYNNFKEMPLMSIELAKLSEEEQKDLTIYISLAELLFNTRVTWSVDIYNSIPYFNAVKGIEGVFFAEYDDPKEIYLSALDIVRKRSDELLPAYEGMSDDGKKKFATQDVIFRGDVRKWLSYADAMRLRLAVRISGVLPDEARTIISEVLSRGNLPTEDLEIEPQEWFRSNRSAGDGGTYRRGMRERDYAGFIPPLLTDIMSRDGKDEYTPGVDDPRMPVLFTGARGSDIATGLYVFRPVNMDCESATTLYDGGGGANGEYGYITDYNSYVDPERYITTNWYMCWNIATYPWNHDPQPVFTTGEVELLKAEIALKNLGNTGATAEQHIHNAIIRSTDYWYRHNAYNQWVGTGADPSPEVKQFLQPAKPDAAMIAAFADVVRNDYLQAADLEAKMEIIMQQKYVHLNVHNPQELFTELRRTRHPKLNPIVFNASTVIHTVINRIPYPQSESANNFEQYSKVIEQDNFTSPIFWMDKPDVSFYKY
ncbi:MAG: SusD/RagB family nutrient-binding outer membrane lipoprotein [Tannerella sp.]|nr:SusD/RagB family nutrient-binding outer membrane lipoprotein [Tannerella sp.]